MLIFFISINTISLLSLSLAFYHMQAGAKVNITAGGATPLHIAADHGSSELINSLLQAGADPNVTDEVSLVIHSFFQNNQLLSFKGFSSDLYAVTY